MTGTREFFRKAELSSLVELLDALGAPGSPAAGVALAYTGAMAAALAEMCLAGRPESGRARQSRQRFVELAKSDAEAYRHYLAAPALEKQAALEEATAPPLAVATEARELWEFLAPWLERVRPPRAADVAAALDLLRTLARASARLARFNARAAGLSLAEPEKRARAVEEWSGAVPAVDR